MKKLLFAAMLIAGSAHAENADLTKIENYLNNISTLEAGFVQMSSNGGSAEGKIYIEKPSKIRMEYTAPDQLLIVGNGEYIIYNDKELDQITKRVRCYFFLQSEIILSVLSILSFGSVRNILLKNIRKNVLIILKTFLR